MLSPDEAYGLVGKIEESRRNLARGQTYLLDFAVSGALGADVGDLGSFATGLEQTAALLSRLQQELADPDGAFGT